MMNTRSLSFIATVTLLVAIPATGFAQDANSPTPDGPPKPTEAERKQPTPQETRYVLDGSTVVAITGDRAHGVGTPCDSPKLHRTVDTLLVACGPRGVYQLALDNPSKPEPTGFLKFDEPVVGFLKNRDTVLVELESGTAKPLSAAKGADATPEAATPPEVPSDDTPSGPVGNQDENEAPPKPQNKAEKRPEGEVVKVLENSVVVSLGESDGLADGDRVELFRRESIALENEDAITRVDRIAVGEAVDVGERNARVTIGLNERVPRGALARPTDGMLTENPVAPRRVGDLWEVSVGVRPMLALGQIGGGALNSARAVYRLDAPFAVHLTATPFSLGFGDQGAASALGGDALFAYDGQLLSIGLGAGAVEIDDFDDSAAGVQSRATLSLSQFIRLGSRDGFNLTLHNSFYLGQDAFRFGGIDGALQIPLDTLFEDTWAVAHVGGHTNQHVVAETGLRVLLRGNGDRGSLFATFTAGGGYVGETDEEPNCRPDVSGNCTDVRGYGGPLVGAELEWRL